MTHEQLTDQYVAGILDGEGSIYFSKMKPDATHKNFSISPRLVITNAYFPVLELINKKYELGKIRFSKQAKRARVYEIRIASPTKIAQFLKTLLPYLIVKKEQALLMLDFFEKRKLVESGKKSHQKGYNSLPQEEIEKREFYYLQMKKMNSYSEDFSLLYSSSRSTISKAA